MSRSLFVDVIFSTEMCSNNGVQMRRRRLFCRLLCLDAHASHLAFCRIQICDNGRDRAAGIFLPQIKRDAPRLKIRPFGRGGPRKYRAKSDGPFHYAFCF